MRPLPGCSSCRSGASRRTSTSRHRRSCSGWPTASQGSGRSRSFPLPQSPFSSCSVVVTGRRSDAGQSWGSSSSSNARRPRVDVGLERRGERSASAATRAGSIAPDPRARGGRCAMGRAARSRGLWSATRQCLDERALEPLGRAGRGRGTPMPYELPHETASIRDGVLRDAPGKPSSRLCPWPCDVEIVTGRRDGQARRPAPVRRRGSGRPHFPAGARGGASRIGRLATGSWPCHGKVIHGDRALDDGRAGDGRTDGAPLVLLQA